MQAMKLGVAGDDDRDIRAMLTSYTTGTFPGEYIPTIFDNYSCNILVDGKPINLGIWDIACFQGEECYNGRLLSYPQTDVFMLLFSLVNPTSYKNIREKWHKEISHHCPGVPIILVGLHFNKSTLGNLAVEKQAPITYEQGLQMANEINAVKYMEADGLIQQNLKEIFDEAVRAFLGVLYPPKKEKITENSIFGKKFAELINYTKKNKLIDVSHENKDENEELVRMNKELKNKLCPALIKRLEEKDATLTKVTINIPYQVKIDVLAPLIQIVKKYSSLREVYINCEIRKEDISKFEKIKMEIACSIEINKQKQNKWFQCAKIGDLKGLDACNKDGMHIQVQNEEGDTALHIAYRENQQKTVEWLLEKKANQNLRNDKEEVYTEAASKFGLSIQKK